MKHRTTRLICLLLLTPTICTITTSVAQSGSNAQQLTPEPDQRKEISIPFEQLESGHMAIQVKINGKGPFRMIFDTGAPGVMFSGKAAKESGLIPADTRHGFLGSYNVGVKDASVEVGEFRADGLVPQVCDHPTVAALASALGSLEGLVGFDLFGAEKLTIDYQAKTITILPGRKPKVFNNVNRTKDVSAEIMGKATTQYAAPAALWGFSVEKQQEDAKPGVDVTAVKQGSAAAEAGLKVGDRLLVMSHRWTDSVADVYRAAGFVWPGKSVRMTVSRGDKELTLTIRPRAGL